MSNRRIVKNSVLLYIRLVVTMLVGLFTSRFVLSSLGVSDYGLYSVVGGIVSMMAFVNTMMITTTYRFITYEEGKSNGDVNRVFNISLSLHMAAAIVILLIAATVGVYYISNHLVIDDGKLADAYFVFVFSVINVLAEVLGTPFRGLLVANEKYGITVPIEIGTKILVLCTAILLNYIPGNHLRYYAVLITLVHCINPLSYAVYCFNRYYETVRWRFQRDWSLYRSMFNFTGWNSLEVAATVGEGQGSAIIINRFFGTVLNASFGVARQINAVVFMVAQGVGQAVTPQITKSYSAGNKDRASHLVIMASKYSFFMMAIPMLPILLEIDFILNLWLTEVPEFTAIFAKAMLIRSTISTSQYGLGPLIDATGNIKLFKITRSALILLGLPMAYLAFWMGYQAYYIIFIYIGMSLVAFMVNIYMLKVILNFNIKDFILKSTMKIILVCLFQVPIFLMINLFPATGFRFVAISLSSEIILFVSIYLVGIENSERKQIIKYVSDVVDKRFSRYRIGGNEKHV